MSPVCYCPICYGLADGLSFTYAYRLADQWFRYLRCGTTYRTVFLGPFPIRHACLDLR
jgi:hypothetical protein